MQVEPLITETIGVFSRFALTRNPPAGRAAYAPHRTECGTCVVYRAAPVRRGKTCRKSLLSEWARRNFGIDALSI
jgi:hypothetical protein